MKNDGTPYKIFTPFYRKGCLNYKLPGNLESQKISFFNHTVKSINVNDLNLRKQSSWEEKLINKWKVGESHAQNMMKSFFSNGIKDYSDGRNFPNKKNVSRLSPYLHWGQISVNQLWYEVEKFRPDVSEENIDIFKSELGWREFFYNLMYHFPEIIQKFTN